MNETAFDKIIVLNYFFKSFNKILVIRMEMLFLKVYGRHAQTAEGMEPSFR